ncbi:hypothetical protein L3X38_015907 [Prunus dulcis]|uniref:Retropepsins domain-containing protein n=1 Tax=Prunus dulcis TaxID=3755 RepID=A0AAD4Z8P0_PRUDU|nr:hypothetical protein L3X38_015907 [Prunus dulcis]
MNFQALNKSPKNHTLLIQSNRPEAVIRVPQTIKWSDVSLPVEWTLKNVNPPTPIQRSLNNLDYIHQYLDGSVKINFGTQPVPKSTVQLQQLPTPGQSQRHIPARHSFAASSSTLERDLEAERALIDFQLESLRKAAQVSQPCYGKQPVDEQKPKSPESPTQTDFEGFDFVDPQLRVLNKFHINWKKLHAHLTAPENQKRRDNYHSSFPLKYRRDAIFNEWKDYLRKEQVEIPYLDYVDTNYMSKKLKEEQEELLIDLICKVENPELKAEYLKKFRKLLSQEGPSQSPPPQKRSLNTTLERFSRKRDITLHDLHSEVKLIKKEIVDLKQLSQKLQAENYEIRQDLIALKPDDLSQSPTNSDDESLNPEQALCLVKRINFKKWYVKVTIFVDQFEFTTVALLDSGADLNCIQEGLIPTKYYTKSCESLRTASGKSLQLNYEIPRAHVNHDGVISTHLGEQAKFEFLSKPELHQKKLVILGSVSKLGMNLSRNKFMNLKLN